MKIIVNGQQQEVQPGLIEQYIEQKGLQKDALVVELNSQIIKQDMWSKTQLQENDVVELLNFVGGG